jgi:tetratricopeptide (TPR) repeat protein
LLPKPVAGNIQWFSGRTWVLPAISDWFENSSERHLLITGSPGAGKTMLMAWLAGFGPSATSAAANDRLYSIRDGVGACHFCRADNGGSTDPRTFARSLAEQLTTRIDGFGEALGRTLGDLVRISATLHVGTAQSSSITGVRIDNIDLGKLGEDWSFNRVIRDPLLALYASGYHRQILIMVDGLDEALTYRGRSIVELLTKLSDLPQAVRFLVSTRPDPRVLRYFRDVRSLDLQQDAPPGTDDVKLYLSARLVESGIDTEQQDRNIDQIAQAAQGNFLYAEFVLRTLLSDHVRAFDGRVMELPPGLGALYHHFLLQSVAADEDQWFDVYRPLFALVAVAQEPGLTRVQLERVLGRDLEAALRACQALLLGQPPTGPFRLFHQSFVEFLLSDEENVDFHVDAARSHGVLANWYMQTYAPSWKDSDEYGLDNVVFHLVESHAIEPLYTLFDRPWIAMRRNQTGSDYALSMDVERLIRMAEIENPVNTVQVARGNMIYTFLGAFAQSTPAEVLAALASISGGAEPCGAAALIPQSRARARAYALIGEALLESGRIEEGRTALLEGLIGTVSVRPGTHRALAIGQFSKHVVQIGEFAALLTAIDGIRDPQGHHWGLLQALWALPFDDGPRVLELLEPIRQRIDAETDDWARTWLLANVAKALAQRGMPGEALPIINEVSSVCESGGAEAAESLSLISAALALVNKPSEARVMAGRTVEADARQQGSPTSHPLVLDGVIDTLARIGDVEQAIAVATNMLTTWGSGSGFATLLRQSASTPQREHVIKRVSDLGAEAEVDPTREYLARGEIATALAEVGATSAALRVLARIPFDDWKSNTQRKIAIEFGRRAAWEPAIELVHAIEDAAIGGGAVADLAELLASAGDIARSRDLAESIVDGHERARALAGVARALVRSGELAAAREVVQQARKIPRAAADNRGLVYLICDLANALHGLGDTSTAIALVNRLTPIGKSSPDLVQRAELAARAARVLSYCGARDEALSVLEEVAPVIGDRSDVTAVCTLASGYLALRIFDRVGELANSATDATTRMNESPIRDDALKENIGLLVDIGRLDDAVTMIGLFQDHATPGIRANAIRRITHAFVARGQVDRALEIVGTMHPDEAPFYGPGILAQIARTVAQTGDTHRALSIAQQIPTEFGRRDLALGNLALVVARMGDTQMAEQIHMRIEKQPARIRACASAAGAMARAGSRARAIQLLQESMSPIESWSADQSAAGILGEVASAFAEIGEPVLAEDMLERGLIALALLSAGSADRRWAVERICPALTSVGQLERALTLVRSDDILSYPRQLIYGKLIGILQSRDQQETAVRIWTMQMADARLIGRQLVFEAIQAGIPLIAATQGASALAAVGEAVLAIHEWGWS